MGAGTGPSGHVFYGGPVRPGMATDGDPGLPLFVGGMLAAICLFVAGLTYVVVPGGFDEGGPVIGLAVGIAGLGGVFLVLGAAVAAVVAVRNG